MSNESLDPDVRELLEKSKAQSIGINFTLTPPGDRRSRRGVAQQPADVRKRIDRLVDQAIERTREQPERVKIFENIGAFLVVASPRFLRELTDEGLTSGEIHSAIANEQPQDLLIRPVEPDSPT